ncbi:MAG: MMPL family transporter [Acidimicrobiaceae bacterium]|jgi:RND superfamily putative drug exporter|nr:MMPL family transporter [Ilumatobacteraceae bacterium]
MKTPPAHGPLASIARFSVAKKKTVMLLWAILTVAAAPLAISLTSALSGAGWDAQGSEAQIVRNELRTQFPQVGAEAAMIVVQQDQSVQTSPQAVQTLATGASTAPGSAGAMNPLEMPKESGLISMDGKTIIIPVMLEGTEDADLPISAGHLMEWLDEQQLPEGTVANATGEWAMWEDFNKENEKALHKAELLSGLPTLILLFIAFGSAIAAGVPLILAIAGIAVGFAVINLASAITPLSVWSMNFSMMIGLAVGIDYSLFIVSRYREEREEGKVMPEAMAGALETAGKAVFLSALTVVLSLAALFFVPIMVFRAMAFGMIVSVIAVAAASLTLLPAVLAGLGDKVLVNRAKEDPDRAAEGRWARWTSKALWKPRRTLIVGLVLMLALAAPALSMRLGMPDATVVDKGAQSRDGNDAVVSAFGPGAVAPFYITTPEADAQKIVDVVASDRNTMMVAPMGVKSAEGRTVVRAFAKTGGSSEETQDMTGRLRTAVQKVSPSTLVGGPGTQNHDLTDALISSAPLAVGLIMLVAFLLLLVVFRSLTIAVASIVLNLISVASSFGFATLVFQHGFGASLIGIEHQGFINAWAPLFFFALLFGLSMDYQLFLLASIKEHHEKSGDTQIAVREGIARTGRPITNAALIMIVVFIAFGVTGPIPPTELGITLAVAVLLDATVIRMMLVPALLGLLDKKAWYIPKWMAKVLPEISFTH